MTASPAPCCVSRCGIGHPNLAFQLTTTGLGGHVGVSKRISGRANLPQSASKKLTLPNDPLLAETADDQDYSWRSVTIGSTFVARKAGIKVASMVMPMRKSETSVKVSGSCAFTP